MGLAKGKRVAERLLESCRKYLEGWLKLKMNTEKSKVTSIFAKKKFKFLGFCLGKNYLYPSTPKVSRQGKRKAETSYKAQTFCKTRCILLRRPYARGSRWLWIEV